MKTKTLSQAVGYVGSIALTVMSMFVLLAAVVGRLAARRPFGERIAGALGLYGLVLLIASVVGIAGATLVSSKPKTGSILMLTGGGVNLALAIFACTLAARWSDFALIILGLVCCRRNYRIADATGDEELGHAYFVIRQDSPVKPFRLRSRINRRMTNGVSVRIERNV